MKKDVILLDNSYLAGKEVYFVRSKIEKYYPLHFHEFYEIELPFEGEGYEMINNHRHDIKKNQIFIFHPTDYHEIFATKPTTLYNIAFTNNAIDEQLITIFLEYQSELVINLSDEKLKHVTNLIETIETTFFSKQENKDLILAHLLNALLLTIIVPKNNINFNHSVTIDILKYIHKNFAKNPSLQDLSDFCGYQKNYLCDYFKKNIGSTYNDYLSNVKIEYSKKLLKISSKSIKQIAFESGFNSANNYIRKFKAKTQQTPMQYRKLYLDTQKNSK